MTRSLALATILLLTVASYGATAARVHRRREGALNQRMTHEQYHTRELADIPAQWLTQKLDHQDITDTRTFQQKFYVNDTFYNASNPIIFLMIGGEGPISPAYVTDHFILGALSVQFGAMQVVLEHRFYGESVPNNDSSTANLKYLSSAQALEDLVTFHEYLNDFYQVDAKFIVFGGSYSGNLAAWAKLKYPQLFLGSFAASAPVQAELDFNQYFEVVSTSVGPTCTQQIAAGQAAVNALMVAPYTKLVDAFGLCAPMQNQQDIANFMDDLSGGFAEAVQYNLDSGKTTWSINTVCELMANATDPLSGLVAVWDAFNTYEGQSGCTDISYANYITSMQPSSAGRSWTWQTCIEFGYFQTGEASTQPFSSNITLAFFVDQCQDIFGIEGLTPNIAWINDFYGGNQIVTSNTVFTNGDVDPWHILGNYQTYPAGSGLSSSLIHGTAHCADLYAAHPTDPPTLAAARANQQTFLTQWLNAGEKKAMLAEQ